jgi:hypothetical protein
MASTNSLNYTAKEYDTIKAEVLTYIQTNYPTKWTDLSNSNAGVILIDIIAYVVGKLNWSIDKVANELFLPTAELKDSILKLAEQVGYRPVGKTAAVILVDATLASALTGSQPAVIRKGQKVTSVTGINFEVREDATITTGNLYPKVIVATELNTTPVNSLLDFTSNSSLVTFSNPGVLTKRLNSAVLPGMFIRSTGGDFDDWYRIVAINADYDQLTLDRKWNAIFNKPFLIRTQGNDTPSSIILLSSTPYGSFPSNAVAEVGNRTVTFTKKLPTTIVPGQWFRLNDPNFCECNKFFQIGSIAQDRLSILLADVNGYGPLNTGGFNALNSTFEIENRSVILVEGQTRSEEFVSSGAAFQNFQLSSTSVIDGSIDVYDEDGILDVDNNPLVWNQVEELSQAIGTKIRSYRTRLLDNDQYEIDFGNGTNGKIPTGKITINYRVGGGEAGNIPQNSIKADTTAYQGTVPYVVKLTNPATQGQGGGDGESVDAIKLNIPAFVRTNLRAVTQEDYQSLILDEYPKSSDPVGTVYIVSINQLLNQVPFGGNIIFVYCWTREVWRPPSSASPSTVEYFRYAPISSALRTSVQTFIDNYRMITDAPSIIKGTVNPAILDIDIQVLPTADVAATKQIVESSIIDLFNSTSTLNRQPILLSDIYGVIESTANVTQVRIREMYLDFEDENSPNTLDDTPAGLQAVSDLYPRDINNVVIPGDISIQAWNKNVGLDLFLNGTLLLTDTPQVDTLARESLRKSMEDFFFTKRPGQGVTIEEITALLAKTTAGSVHIYDNIKVATTSNIDIFNYAALTSLSIDSVTLNEGDHFLLKNQVSPAENGFYTLISKDGVNPWVAARKTDAANYHTLTPGSYCVIQQGVANAGASFYMTTKTLSATNFSTEPKAFTAGTRDAAENSILAISSFTVKFDSPIGNTDTAKLGVENVVYYMRVLDINGSSGLTP